MENVECFWVNDCVRTESRRTPRYLQLDRRLRSNWFGPV